MEIIWNWIKTNHEWVFSGIGVFILSIFIALFKRKKKILKSDQSNGNYFNINHSPIQIGDKNIQNISFISVKESNRFTKNLTSLPYKYPDFIGRNEELELLNTSLADQSSCVLVNGIGGIGKTELCRKYFWSSYNKFTHLAWIDYLSSIKESFVGQFKIEDLQFTDKDTLDKRFDQIFNYLSNLDQNSLLIIDNIDNIEDNELLKIRSLPFHIIITSRSSLSGFQKIEIGSLGIHESKCLFYQFYKGQQNDPILEKIIELTAQHTLTIELLAKIAQFDTLELHKLYEKIVRVSFNINAPLIASDGALLSKQRETKTLYEHLVKVFDISRLTKNEEYILINLSVLPSIFIDINDFEKWFKLKRKTKNFIMNFLLRMFFNFDSKRNIGSLVKKGWLQQNGFQICIHQIIQEVIKYKVKPTIGKCFTLIDTLTEKLYLDPNDNPLSKSKYIEFGYSILKNIPGKNSVLLTLSNNLSIIYKELGLLEKASITQMNTVTCAEEIFGLNHLFVATAYNNLSVIYQDLGNLEGALDFQLKSLKIRQKLLDQKDQCLATSYTNLGTIYWEIWEWGTKDNPEIINKALEYNLKAIEINEEVLSPLHPNLALSYNNLSLVFQAAGDLENALEYQLKSFKIFEQIFDSMHPNFVMSLSNLATIYRDLNDTEKALQLGLKAVEIWEKIVEPKHHKLANEYWVLSSIYFLKKDYNEAFELCKKAVYIFKLNFPNGHPRLKIALKDLKKIESFL